MNFRLFNRDALKLISFMYAKPVFYALILMLLHSSALARQQKLTITTEHKSDNSVEFIYEKTDPGTYTVQMTFSSLENGSVQALYYNASSYSGKLFTITPIDKSRPVRFSYRYNFIPGKLDPRYNPGFSYLLPYPEGTPVQVAETTFLGSIYFGEETPDDWNSYRYYTKEQTKITAMRKGVVVAIVDEHDTPERGGVSYTSLVNSITIEHEDGTMAHYRGFKKGSFEVKIGETVYPTTVLGLNTRIDQDRDYYVSVIIQYLKTIVLDPTTKLMARSGRFYGFVTPYFVAAEGNKIILEHGKEYKAAAPQEIVSQEMSRREKRRWETGS